MINNSAIGIIGSGTMGAGIAQIAATSWHKVLLYDHDGSALKNAQLQLLKILERLVEKDKLNKQSSDEIYGRIAWISDLKAFDKCEMIIEAITENQDAKKTIFKKTETVVSENCILASNTSSLSITSIAGACKIPERVIGIHFFNPAPLMPLVEIIPAMQTGEKTVSDSIKLIGSWGKTTVLAKDTPGFIVNRIARPFYGEAIRVYEEGFADFATIDHAMKEKGGFRMGPFELMDLIGNDVNYEVTRNIWEQFFYEPRYKPSFTQKRMVEAGWLGRKTGRGYYDYNKNSKISKHKDGNELEENIFWRILVMLINEAADALYLNIATRDDIDMAMTTGVNYPKGLLKWADEKGIGHCLKTMERLQSEYGEDRYRPSPLFKKMMREKRTFY